MNIKIWNIIFSLSLLCSLKPRKYNSSSFFSSYPLLTPQKTKKIPFFPTKIPQYRYQNPNPHHTTPRRTTPIQLSSHRCSFFQTYTYIKYGRFQSKSQNHSWKKPLRFTLSRIEPQVLAQVYIYFCSSSSSVFLCVSAVSESEYNFALFLFQKKMGLFTREISAEVWCRRDLLFIEGKSESISKRVVRFCGVWCWRSCHHS